MQPVQPLELLNDIKESSDEYQHIIFGTYTFDPAFFEGKLLRLLQERDAENILVLIDQSEYTRRFTEVKRAGVEYYFDYCKSKKIFHPKFALFLWSEGGKFLISSANLTDNDWLAAGQLVISLDYNQLKPDIDIASCFWQMKEFLQGLIDKGLIVSKKHRGKLKEALTDIEWLKKLERPEIPEPKIILIHNLNEAILSQVLKAIGKEKIVQVDIFSPYFDTGASVIKELTKMGCQEFRLYLQPDKVEGFPLDEIVADIRKGLKIKLTAVHFEDNEKRYIHAKLLIIKTNRASYCLVGSANATRNGMLSVAEDGNVELCILRRSLEKEHFDYIFDPSIFNIVEIKPESVEVRPIQRPPPGFNPDFYLTDARLEKRELWIEFAPCLFSSQVNVLLRHYDGEEPLQLISAVEKDGDSGIIKCELNEKYLTFCAEPTFVSLRVDSNGKSLVSDRRWISTAALETMPRRRDVARISETHGRFGLISMFNQLEKTDESLMLFLYYLRWVNFEDLGESLNWIRRRLLKRTTDTENIENAQLEERSRMDVKAVIENIINKHRERFEKSVDSFRIDAKLPLTFENLFNMFMFLNKITFWFVLNDKSIIEELRHIKSNLENMRKLVNRIYEEVPRERFWSLMEKNRVPEHLMIICYLIDMIHKQRNYELENGGRCKNVVPAFRDTYSRVLRQWRTDETSRMPLAKYLPSIVEAAREYEEFEGLRLEPKVVVESCQDMIKVRPA